MHWATITYTEPRPWPATGYGLESVEVEQENIEHLHAYVVGVVQGLVGNGNPMERAITNIEIVGDEK